MIAFTMTRFAYKVIPQEGAAIINTSTLFYPCNSWLNSRNINGSIAHEQLHFDIAEYYKRLFIKNVTETKASEDLFPVTTKAIFRDLADQKRTMNTDYDRQTNYGLNAQEQKKWDQKISSLLHELEKYSGNIFTVKLK